MLKVCIDARWLGAPGIGTYLKNLLPLLSRYPVHYFALIHPSMRAELKRLCSAEPILLFSKAYTLKEQVELAWKIPPIDLFWSVHSNVPWLPIRAKKRLITLHDVLYLSEEGGLHFIQKQCAKWIMQAALRLSDQIITISSFSKENIEKVLKRPICVIPHGVDPHHFSSDGEVHAVQKYGIHKPFILYVGSFKAHKNLRGVAESFAKLTWQYPELSCVIIGRGEGMRRTQDVKQLYNTFPEIQGKFHCIGPVADEELPHFYRSAELLLFPSFYEGFGLPPLEAMSCGCPVVVSNRAALPEVCKEAAVYVNPYDPTDIAARCDELLRDRALREKFAHLGKENSRLFCWKRCAKEHYSVMKKMIHG